MAVYFFLFYLLRRNALLINSQKLSWTGNCKGNTYHPHKIPSTHIWLHTKSLAECPLLTPFESFGAICRLVEVHPIPSSVSLVKMLKCTGLRMDSWGTPYVSDLYLNIKPLATLWLWPSNQFFIHWIVWPANPYFSNFEIRVWCTTRLTTSVDISVDISSSPSVVSTMVRSRWSMLMSYTKM